MWGMGIIVDTDDMMLHSSKLLRNEKYGSERRNSLTNRPESDCEIGKMLLGRKSVYP
jgi:hypothetical protein